MQLSAIEPSSTLRACSHVHAGLRFRALGFRALGLEGLRARGVSLLVKLKKPEQ